MENQNETCSIGLCGNSVAIKWLKLCYGHYMRWYRYGDPQYVPEHRAGPKPGPRPYRRKNASL